MNKNVYDYFENLDKKDLPRKKGSLIFDNKQISNFSLEEIYNYCIPKIEIENKPYFIKRADTLPSPIATTCSKMYNQLNVITPPTYIIKNTTQIPELLRKTNYIATQDVNSIDGIRAEMAKEVLDSKDIPRHLLLNGDKWKPLYDTETQQLLLSFMTKDCFNQLVSLFLIDELRTESDRHLRNYFYIKSPESEKFEGVISIDNELCELLKHPTSTKNDFKSFLYYNYSTPTMLGSRENYCYYQKIDNIKELVYDGVLTNEQIELLKNAVLFDFPNSIKNDTKKLKLNKFKKELYDSFSRLWEYHQNNLGRELGL
jgi:hypothetical protein